MGEVDMESLAFFISILLLITVASGPVSILLTSRFAQSLTVKPTVNIFRRALLILVGALGILVSFLFILSPIPLFPKVISLASILANAWSIDREFGGRLMDRLKTIFGKRV
jgi:hypothetical protein